MKKRKLKVIILALVIIEGVFIYLNYQSYNKENTQVFNEVKIADNLKNTKQIAIMQQKEDFTWEDKGTSASSWPDIKTFEYYGSECTDAAGKPITPTTEVIQFDEQNQTATISTSKTIYCTLKFARRSKVLELMQKTETTYLKTVDTSDELLRYIGTKDQVKKNYICFGTENKDTCLGNKGTYMYRIIGITTDKVNTSLGLTKNQLKIIKATPSNTSQAWATDQYSNYDWDNSNASARTYLNGTFLNSITGITTKVGTHNWSDLITSEKWYKGDNTSATSSKTEVKTLTTGSYKVGLMYASDYVNSGTQNTTNWLFIQNGMSGSTSTFEWTMTRSGSGRVWVARGSGDLEYAWVNNALAVRPVFYLTSEISISGAGTESDPFIISDKIVS